MNGLLVFLALAVAAPQPADRPTLAVRLDASTVSSRFAVLSAGLMLAHSSGTTTLYVKAMHAPMIVDAFSTGGVSAAWKDADLAKQLVTRRELARDEEAELIVTYSADHLTAPSYVSFWSLGVELMTVMFVPEITTETTKTVAVGSDWLVSGKGESFSPWYRLCTGPAPLGYTYSSSKVEVFGYSRVRGCNSWGKCEAESSSNDNVCYRVSVQGHRECEWAGASCTDMTTGFRATVTATYAFKGTLATLTAVPDSPPAPPGSSTPR